MGTQGYYNQLAGMSLVALLEELEHEEQALRDILAEMPYEEAGHQAAETRENIRMVKQYIAEKEVAAERESTREKRTASEKPAFERHEMTSKELARKRHRESLELSQLAEMKFRTNDVISAVQVIAEAIEGDPDFVPYYLQQARYLKYHGNSTEAVAALKHAFSHDLSLVDYFGGLIKGRMPSEYSHLKHEIESLVHTFKRDAYKKAEEAASEAFAQVERMKSKFKRGELPEFVRQVVAEGDELKEVLACDNYVTLLSVPHRAVELGEKGQDAIARLNQSAAEAEKTVLQADRILQQAMAEKVSEFAHDEIKKATEGIESAKQHLGMCTYLGYETSLELARECIRNAERAGKIKRKIAEAEETVLQADQILQQALVGRLAEFAPNEIKNATEYLDSAKQHLGMRTYVDYEASLELARDCIQNAERAEKIKRKELHDRRAAAQAEFKAIEYEANQAKWAVERGYEGDIDDAKKERNECERKLHDRTRRNRPGCGIWILIIVLAISSLQVFESLITSWSAVIRILATSIVGLFIAFRYIPILLARSDLASAENDLKRLIDKRDAELNALKRQFAKNPNVIKLQETLRNMER